MPERGASPEFFSLPKSLALSSLSERLRLRSEAVLGWLERRAGGLVLLWLVLAGAGAAVRLSARLDDATAWLPYLLFVLGPAAALAAGLTAYAGREAPRPVARHPLYGAGGLMLSLLLALAAAMLLRGASYLAAVPAVGSGGSAWLSALHGWLTLDAILTCSFYAVAFAAGLRRSLHFPALLAGAWSVDLALQLIMASAMRGIAMPAEVAAAFHQLLQGNLTRVMVSLAIWFPYLLLSERVAVTYRHELRPRLG